MNSLKELVNKIHNDLQESDWIKEYPDLTDKSIVGEILQWIALDKMPQFVEEDRLEEFVEESEKNYKEETFKKYIEDYSNFLDNIESEFYNGLLLWLAE